MGAAFGTNDVVGGEGRLGDERRLLAERTVALRELRRRLRARRPEQKRGKQNRQFDAEEETTLSFERDGQIDLWRSPDHLGTFFFSLQISRLQSRAFETA